MEVDARQAVVWRVLGSGALGQQNPLHDVDDLVDLGLTLQLFVVRGVWRLLGLGERHEEQLLLVEAERVDVFKDSLLDKIS